MSTKLLVSGLVASTLVLGAVGEAEAANLLRSWEASEAYRDNGSDHGAGHAFWLPELVGGGRFVFDSQAIFNEYDDGTANFTGSIVAANDSNKQWDFDLWFDYLGEGVDGQGTSGPKKELGGSAYVENGGSIDTDTWWYYDFSSTIDSTLSADSGTYAGETVVLYDYTNGGYPLQIGHGANGKNTGLGLSTWFGYEGDYNSGRNSDINIDLKEIVVSETPAQDIPEPSMGLLTLGLLGFGAKFLKGKQG